MKWHALGIKSGQFVVKRMMKTVKNGFVRNPSWGEDIRCQWALFISCTNSNKYL